MLARATLSLALLLCGCVDKIPDLDRDGYDLEQGDCDDRDAARNPGATEVCNGIDDDCDEAIDDVDEDGDGVSLCDDDCNDGSANQFPGHEETCDAVDNDCNGLVDDGFDLDGDGVAFCAVPPDCDDEDATVHPEAPELCNGEDEDCDGLVDEDFDQDGDGFRTCDDPADCDDINPQIHPGAQELCEPQGDYDCDGVFGSADQDGDGWAPCQGDCDDFANFIHPSAIESCDNIDNDCDGVVDDGFDQDADGVTSCGGDCDDFDPGLFPGNPEICDQLDQDCDEDIDEDFNLDNDDYSTCALPVPDCDDTDFTVYPNQDEDCDGIDNNCDGVVDEGYDLDGDGVAPCVGDCDDTNPAVFPGQTEQCNETDDDCNGLIDEGFDDDADGVSACDGDCDDTDPAVNPSASELCDAIDNDCDIDVDEDFDADGDTATTCGPDGVLGTADDDCNDAWDTIFPGALEVCDGLDSNCDGFLPTVEEDADADTVPACLGDCDDNDDANWPGNVEICDGGDNDCDTEEDEGFDADGDGVLTCGADGLPGTADDDCDDADPSNAGPFIEVCDAADNDCDGVADNGFDLDADGATTCGPDTVVGTPDDDCDDTDPSVFPGAVQGCTSADNDCDGQPGDLDEDLDGSLICEDCDDTNPQVLPGAGFSVCDGTDYDCDGVPEDEIVVAFLPGQQSSWANLPALHDLVAQSPGYGGCALTFVDIASPVSETALDATGAHVAMLSSPGENCTTYDASDRDELEGWLLGNGRGIVITGTLGTNACQTFTDRYELATLAGVTLSSASPDTSLSPLVARTGASFWAGISPFSYTSSGDTQADNVVGLCTGATLEGLVGDQLNETPRQLVRYEANPLAPCLASVSMDHRAAWFPLQPEDGGNLTDRRLLFNAIDWIKSEL